MYMDWDEAWRLHDSNSALGGTFVERNQGSEHVYWHAGAWCDVKDWAGVELPGCADARWWRESEKTCSSSLRTRVGGRFSDKV